MKIEIDKRNTSVKQLKEILVTLCTDVAPNVESQTRREEILNMIFSESATHWLLASRVDTSATSAGRFAFFISSVLDDQEANLYNLISSNKKKVLILSRNRDFWPVGERFEPVRVVAKFFDQLYEIREVSFTFTKCTLMTQVKQVIASNIFSNKVQLSSLSFQIIRSKFGKAEGTKVPIEDRKSLSDFDVKNGDFIVIETELPVDQLFDSSVPILPSKPDSTRQITIFNCLDTIKSSKDILDQKTEILVDETTSVNAIRTQVLSNMNRKDHIEDSQLRLIQEDDVQGESDWMLQLLSRDPRNQHLAYPGLCLYEDINFEEVLKSIKTPSSDEGFEQRCVFLICPGRGPRQVKLYQMIKLM